MKSITASQLFERLKPVRMGGTTCQYTLQKCEGYVDSINKINKLKKLKNAVILAHSYVSPEIVYGVADFNGDSYGLSKDAANTSADIIVFAAVRFMAETAKILSPDKTVLVPSRPSGCSLADSITGDDIRRLKKENPDFAFICYINTTADVKAECDCCVTSSNVYDIVEKYPSDKIFFVPDRLMGLNIQDEMKRRGVKKEIKLYHGTCYVHEDYDPEMITAIRRRHHDVKILAHPECSPGILTHADFVGSTSQMLNYVKQSPDAEFMMLTECGLTGRLEAELPEKHFVGACTMCKYMKANTLDDILRVLQDPKAEDEIHLSADIISRARRSIDAMFQYAEK